MCGGLIDWCAFTWEAFATLVTGLLAVGGASLIGFGQMKIQEKQVDLQDLALRSDLFERRYSVYERVREFVVEICQTADSPEWETQQNFFVAKGEAKFLFDDKVVEGVDEIWKRACDFRALKQTMNRIYSNEGHYGDGNVDKERDASEWWSDRLITIPDLFDQLKLSGKLVPFRD